MNKWLRKLTGFIALTVSLSTVEIFSNATVETTLSSPMASLRKILTSPAAQKVFGRTRTLAYKKLADEKELGNLVTFALSNGPLFAKWPAICSDFIEQLTQTMPVEDILNKIGLNKATITSEPASQLQIESAADIMAKDGVITAILKNSKLNALAGLISMGIGYVSSFVYSRTPAVENTELTTENLMQAALRTALKKNLKLTELKALQTFSNSKAFSILVDNFDTIKNLFITELIDEDPSVIETLYTSLATISVNSNPTADVCTCAGAARLTRFVTDAEPARLISCAS